VYREFCCEAASFSTLKIKSFALLETIVFISYEK